MFKNNSRETQKLGGKYFKVCCECSPYQSNNCVRENSTIISNIHKIY